MTAKTSTPKTTLSTRLPPQAGASPWVPGRPKISDDPLDPEIGVPVNPSFRHPNPRKRVAPPLPIRQRRRKRDWISRLDSFFQARKSMKFAWGTNDCMTFAGDAVILQGFADPMKDWRGSYSTARQAAELLNAKQNGIMGWAHEIFSDFTAARTRSAKRGDVVLLEVDREIAFGTTRTNLVMGVCAGAVAVVLSDKGTMEVDMARARFAWLIGHK